MLFISLIMRTAITAKTFICKDISPIAIYTTAMSSIHSTTTITMIRRYVCFHRLNNLIDFSDADEDNLNDRQNF